VPVTSVFLARGLKLLFNAGSTAQVVSRPGGAGHALLFQDQIILKKDFQVLGLGS
jgi:hypothetical protein